MTSSVTNFRVRAKDRTYEGLTREKEGKWNGPFCFIQAADTQLGLMAHYNQKTKYEDITWQEEIDLMRRAIQAANDMKPKPRFFIVCGDLVDAMPGDGYKPGQEADFKQVFAELHPEIFPVCVCGNHDIGNTPTHDSVRDYRENFGDDYFTFWAGGVKCIVINSQFYEDRSQVLDLAEEQDNWLDEELKNSKEEGCQHLLVFQHIPWFLFDPEEEKEYFNIVQPVRRNMLDKFCRAGVKTIFCGHYHRNAGGFYKGMELVVTSAIGCQIGSDRHGMRVVKIDEKTVSHKYYALEDVPKSVEFSTTSHL